MISSASSRGVIILAAGRGRRLMPFTAEVPKCLVRIGQYPILFYQLRALERYGLQHICIVTGYQAEQIRQYVAEHFAHLDVRFIHNRIYAATNDIYSLYLARRNWRENIVILDSDVLFSPAILSRLLSFPDSALCLRRVLCGAEEMKVSATAHNTVAHISKELSPKDAIGESLGIMLFREDFSSKFLRALEEIVLDGGRHLYREAAIEKALHDDAAKLYCLDVTQYPAIEIDFPEDLREAEERILPKIIHEFA